MHKEVRELIDKAELLGFQNQGTDGSGHYVLICNNGGQVRVPSTPSDWRTRFNFITQMERVSGRKLPRPNAAKYRHRRAKTSDFNRSHSEQLGIERRNKVIEEAEQLRVEWNELILGPINRDTANLARRIQQRFSDKQALLNRHCCYIPDLSE